MFLATTSYVGSNEPKLTISAQFAQVLLTAQSVIQYVAIAMYPGPMKRRRKKGLTHAN